MLFCLCVNFIMNNILICRSNRFTDKPHICMKNTDKVQIIFRF